MQRVWQEEWLSEADCAAAARTCAGQLRGGMTIGLSGELGAGKTTFVRYLAAALGVAEAVTSPTFVLQHEYAVSQGTLEHWDVYRLSDLPDELFEAPNRETIRLIEWFDKFEELRSELALSIEISTRLADGSLVRMVRYSAGGDLLQDNSR